MLIIIIPIVESESNDSSQIKNMADENYPLYPVPILFIGIIKDPSIIGFLDAEDVSFQALMVFQLGGSGRYVYAERLMHIGGFGGIVTPRFLVGHIYKNYPGW